MPTEAEWRTRKTRIDTKLGTTRPPWTIVPYRDGMDESALTHHAVTEYPTSNGPADYALFVNGRLLGIIEAKKVGVGPQNVLEQARRYSRGVTVGSGNWNGYRVPFLYATNGEVFWYSDERLPNAMSHPPFSPALSPASSAPMTPPTNRRLLCSNGSRGGTCWLDLSNRRAERQ